MVPVGAYIVVHREIVKHSTAWRNWTLRQEGHTVHRGGSVLEETVEMHRSIGVVHSVSQVNLHTVTFVDRYIWPWELAITGDHGTAL